MTLGNVISEYRAEHSMSMDKFAKLSGISKAYISILERNQTPRGDEPSPSYEMYKAVAKTIGMNVDELIRKVEGNISFSEEELTEEEDESWKARQDAFDRTEMRVLFDAAKDVPASKIYEVVAMLEKFKEDSR